MHYSQHGYGNVQRQQGIIRINQNKGHWSLVMHFQSVLFGVASDVLGDIDMQI